MLGCTVELAALRKDCRTEDSETMCILALMKDAVMRQRGDAHDGTAENYWMTAI